MDPLVDDQWCNLPLDILESISERLDSDIDLLRLRAVCTSWRCYLSLLYYSKNNLLSRFSRYLPFWSSSSSAHGEEDAATKCVNGSLILKECTIYRIEGADKSSKACWLAKLQETTPGNMRILDLLSCDQTCDSPEMFPKEIDLSDFRVKVIHKAYHLEHRNRVQDGVYCWGERCFYSLNADKVAVMSSAKDYAILAIHSVGKLGFLRAGEETWRVLDDTWNALYEDIINYEGGLCVVDDKGKTVKYDSSFRASEVAMGLAGGGGHKKHLVESLGRLLLVDKYVKHVWQRGLSKAAVEFKVYTLNGERKEWDEVKGLGNEAVFIGEDCSFSISAGDFPGLQGNCIFYKDYRNGGGQLKGLSSGDASSGIFNRETASVYPAGPVFYNHILRSET